MPLRHEDKEDGRSPLKGEFGMTYSLVPALTKTTDSTKVGFVFFVST